jgi:hypothetical protein
MAPPGKHCENRTASVAADGKMNGIASKRRRVEKWGSTLAAENKQKIKRKRVDRGYSRKGE